MSSGLRILVVAVLLAAVGAPVRSLADQRQTGPRWNPALFADVQKPDVGEVDDLPPPSQDPPADEIPPPEVFEVSGHERLAWDQMADSVEELNSLGYVVFVDSEPRELTEVSCSDQAGPEGFECHSALPEMAPGEHWIEVSAYTVNDDVREESSRSAPIGVRLQAPGVATSAHGVAVRLGPRGTAMVLNAATIARGLDDPTDIAVLPDGRVLITERAGRIYLLRDGAVVGASLLADIVTGQGRGLLSVAVDGAFDRTGHVYLLFSSPSGVALARMTVVADTLVDRAVLVDGLPVSGTQPSASVRVGPDGKLHVVLDSSGDPSKVGDLGSYSGKVLRLSTDGTTPADQPRHSPVLQAGLDYPAGLAWGHDQSMLWITGRDASSRDRLDMIPVDATRDSPDAVHFTLPAGTGASAIVFYSHAGSPELQGSLLVGASVAGGLLRIWFDQAGAVAGTEWWLQDELGSVRAIAVGPDGAIYAVNDHALLRVAARGR